MEKIIFIVDVLNQPPFNKGIATLTELDSKHGTELIDLLCEVVVALDPDQEGIYKEPLEYRIPRILDFLRMLKFQIADENYDDFQSMLLSGDKDLIYTILHWILSKFESLQKRAYLAKYLMNEPIPAEFYNDDLIVELTERLKELQGEFKEVHKAAEEVRKSGVKPSDLKQEIIQLETEKTQLQNKLQKMKKDLNVDEDRFKEMLKATNSLRKEQENEVMIHERMREHRRASQEIEMRYADASRRLSELKTSGIQSQSAEQILAKLSQDVRELSDRRENVERIIAEREMHLEKLQGWDNSDRMTSEDDIRNKRDQVEDLHDQVSSLTERLDAAVERNTKLVVSRQASALALRKYREREEEVEGLQEELRRIHRQMEEKEAEVREKNRHLASGTGPGRVTKKEVKRYGQVVREKMEVYKKVKGEIEAMRAELVVLQQTEDRLKERDHNLDEFLTELEKQKGVEGYRETQRALVEMAEKTAEIDQMKGATLEEISSMVENITREFKSKQQQLQPLIAELKSVRQEYLDVESQYQEKKMSYEKVAVGLEMEKQALEKDCNQFQDECLREESRYHQMQNMISITKIRLERCEQEKKWQNGTGRLMRDFASLKELYTNKLAQQEQLTKQLRKKQKELKENSGALTNQKSNFMNLQVLLEAKARVQSGEPAILTIADGSSAVGGSRITSAAGEYSSAYAEDRITSGDGNAQSKFGDKESYY